MIHPFWSLNFTIRRIIELFQWMCRKPSHTLIGMIVILGATNLYLCLYPPFYMVVITLILFPISVIDITDHIIPDILIILLGGVCSLVLPLNEGLIVKAIGYLIFILGLHTYRKLTHKILMGWGDIKLLGVMIVFTPLAYLPIFLILSGLSIVLFASIFSVKKIPFAPFFSAGFLWVCS